MASAKAEGDDDGSAWGAVWCSPVRPFVAMVHCHICKPWAASDLARIVFVDTY